MNKNVLNTGVQDFIRNYSSSDILAVLLKKPFFEAVSNKELVQQLEGRQKCKDKLPSWYGTPQIYYPEKRALEQSSSEQTARYKADLVSGNSLIDLTGGLGVDSYYFSKRVSTSTYCEKQEELAAIAGHNFRVLGAENIRVVHGDGIEYLKSQESEFDWVYLDPSRRTEAKGKVFLLEDAEPRLPESLSVIWPKSRRILIKTSPLLDLSSGLQALEHVREIHVLAIKNEVKEILWVLEKGFTAEPIVKTINLKTDRAEHFDFYPMQEKEAVSHFGPVANYIYEPNAALMKAGAFKLIGQRLGLRKLHEHTHLYTAEVLIDFPGRRFELLKAYDYSVKKIKQLKIEKANISTRNFPKSVAALRKELRIADGGQDSLFFVRDDRAKAVMLHCKRI